MKKKILTAVLFAGLVASAGAIQAQEQGERERADFATLDLNGDGGLTLEELQAQREARFLDIDANGDGGLSAEEMIAAAGSRAEDRAARLIERFDDNGDGVLQQTELPTRGADRAERMFERADADDDGVLSEEEFKSAQERRGDGKRDRG